MRIWRVSMNSKKRIDMVMGVGFITPALLVIGIFIVFSLLYGLFMSFFQFNFLLDGSIQKSFIGLENYRKVLSDDPTKIAYLNSLKYTLMVVPAQIVLSIGLAVILNSKVKFKNGFRALFFFPVLTSTAALSMIFMFLFNPNGPVNDFLISIGLIENGINFFNNPNYALQIIAVMGVWKAIPFSTTVILASLVDVPKSLYESADIDGAGNWMKFWKITMPAIKPAVVFISVIAIVGCLQMFDETFIISGGSGGPADSTLTIALLIYNYAFNVSYSSMGYAAALSIVLGIIIFIITFVIRKVFKSESMY